MSEKLDPKKAVYFKPGQRTIPGRKRSKSQNGAGELVEHAASLRGELCPRRVERDHPRHAQADISRS